MDSDFYARYFELEENHWWFLGRRRIVLGLLEQHLNGSRDLDILDVGCGTGRTTQELRRFGSPRGVDMDADAVRFCRERGIADVRLLEEGRLPFPDESFDVVTALDVIEHIDDDDGMLREMRRVLRPGGIALITVPAFQALWGLQDEVSHHKRRYRAPQLRDRIAGAGLGAAWTSYFNTLLFLPIAALRLARRVLPKPPEVQSDFELGLPPRINAALADLFAAEGRVMRRLRLPFGVSIVAVATREDGPRL